MQSTDLIADPPLESDPGPDRSNHPDVERLIAEHGSALSALASIILIDRAEAEDEVTRMLAHVCELPIAIHDSGTRKRLSRRLYLNCTWARLVSDGPPAAPSRLESSPDGFDASIARLTALSKQQRAAIALFLYGDHTYREMAELLAIPELVVLGLLGSGLAELLL
ncbi:hypothetical protein [Aeromicrobium sp.]